MGLFATEPPEFTPGIVRGVEIIGLLMVAIWKILHTRTLLSSRADNIEPKKGRLGLQKWLSRLEKTIFFAITAQNSIGRHIRMVIRS